MAQSTVKHGMYSLKELKAKGIRVEEVNSSISLSDRESCITWNEEAKEAELALFTPRWQKKLETLGYLPHEVYTYPDSAEVRFYRGVPKSILRLPAAKRKVSEVTRTRLAKQLSLHRPRAPKSQ
jgi:hypothetical protein